MSSRFDNDGTFVTAFIIRDRVPLLDEHISALSKIELNDTTTDLFNAISDDVFSQTHGISTDLVGRDAKVYFLDTPSIYQIVEDPSKGIILVPNDEHFRIEEEKYIHIDPRALPRVYEQLPEVRENESDWLLDIHEGVFRNEEDQCDEDEDDNGGGDDQGQQGQGQYTQQQQTVVSGSGGPIYSQQNASSNKPFNNKSRRGPRKAQYDSYNKYFQLCPDMRTKLPPMVLSARELLTFFPHASKWPAVGLRLFFNEWTQSQIGRAQLDARLPPGQSITRADYVRAYGKIRHQIRTITLGKHSMKPSTVKDLPHAQCHPFNPSVTGNNEDLYDVTLPLQQTGDRFEPPRNLGTTLRPITLFNVVQGVDVSKWPTGEDEGPFTKVLRRARQMGTLTTLTTDDAPLEAVHLAHPAVPGEASTILWDVNAARRLHIAVPTPS